MPDKQNREYDTPTQPTENTERTRVEDQAYPLEEAMKAQAALRSAAHTPPERFLLPALIGMFSDEIQALREQGRPDDEIAAIINGSSVINVDADSIQRFYVGPQDRHRS